MIRTPLLTPGNRSGSRGRDVILGAKLKKAREKRGGAV